MGDDIALGAVQCAVGSPRLFSRIAWVYVSAQASPDVVVRRDSPEEFASGCVSELNPCRVRPGLMYRKHLEPRSIRIQVSQVHCIPMSEASVVEAGPVMIYRTCSVDDLVFPVEVHVRNAQVVIPLPCILRIAFVRIEGPELRELAISPVVGDEHGPGVVSSAHDQAGHLPVQIRYAGQETIHSVPVVVAPVGHPPSRRVVVDGHERLAGLSFEYGQVLRA